MKTPKPQNPKTPKPLNIEFRMQNACFNFLGIYSVKIKLYKK